MTAAERDRRIAEHYRSETERFALKPWECRPVFAGGEAPDPGDITMRAKTWHRARKLREQLLSANPKHYADIGE